MRDLVPLALDFFADGFPDGVAEGNESLVGDLLEADPLLDRNHDGRTLQFTRWTFSRHRATLQTDGTAEGQNAIDRFGSRLRVITRVIAQTTLQARVLSVEQPTTSELRDPGRTAPD